MGGGISISSYPEKLTSSDIKEICGGILNEPLFNCIKDEDQTISRDKFFKIIKESVEQEILLLYFHFTKHRMTIEQYLQFMIHCRLLTKNHFKRKDSESFFFNNTINYMQLRFDIFPEIAIKKGITIQLFLIKLSRLNPPNYKENDEKENNNENNENNSEKINKENEKNQFEIEASISSQSLTTTFNDQTTTNNELSLRNNAAIKIQKIQRTWLARNDLQREKEIKSILDSTIDDIKVNERIKEIEEQDDQIKEWNSRNSQVYNDKPEEIRCHLLYQKFSNNGEMDIKDFIRLCYDTELIPYDSININFTGKDAQHIFKKTITKHFNPLTNTYREGVVHGKRILYKIFRLRILPEIAEMKDMSINNLVIYLGNCSGKIRRHSDHGKYGPRLFSLLDQKHIDDKLIENTLQYGEHVEES